MINVKISKDTSFIDPIDTFGALDGEVYQMYFNGHPDETYFIGVGRGEGPLIIWFDTEESKYKLSTSTSIKDLEGYLPNVKVKQIKADIDIKIHIPEISK